jgi:MoaA/NifB/PqqE/SkfB family radical SAM enzyme
LIGSTGVKTWELFFLVKVGRGADVEELSPEQYESVCNFLYDALFYGVTIRCVEAPFIRRVVTQRGKDGRYWDHAEYEQLRAQLLESEGQSQKLESTTIRPSGTLDGDGILFVVYDGTIHLGGLLPFKLGNVKNDQLIEVYRNNDLLRKIRQRDFQRLLRRM